MAKSTKQPMSDERRAEILEMCREQAEVRKMESEVEAMMRLEELENEVARVRKALEEGNFAVQENISGIAWNLGVALGSAAATHRQVNDLKRIEG